jgi:hypothetical protein
VPVCLSKGNTDTVRVNDYAGILFNDDLLAVHDVNARLQSALATQSVDIGIFMEQHA